MLLYGCMVLTYEVPFLVENWRNTNVYTICEASSAQGNFHVCSRQSIAKFPRWPAKTQQSPQTGRNEVLTFPCLLKVAKGQLCPLAGCCFWAEGHNVDCLRRQTAASSGVSPGKGRSWGQERTQPLKAKEERVLLRIHFGFSN